MFSVTDYGAPEPDDAWDPEEAQADALLGEYSAAEEAFDDYLDDVSKGWA